MLSLNNVLEDEVDRLKKIIETYTDQERNLTDFRNLTPKRSHEMREKSAFKNALDKEL